MKLTTHWKGKYRFDATDGENTASMDIKAPHGDESALSPKQLCLASITGCTAMDVVSHLNKRKHPPQDMRIEADAEVKPTSPAVFLKVELDLYLEGEMPAELALEAMRLSQTKYCGVSAMIAKSCPIHYRVHLNGELVGEGQASFSE